MCIRDSLLIRQSFLVYIFAYAARGVSTHHGFGAVSVSYTHLDVYKRQGFQQTVVVVYRHQGVDNEGDEAQIIFGGLARSHQQDAGVCTQ